MTFVKINGNLYPATISGKMVDREWDDRESKSITLEMGYAEAVELFVDGLPWSIVEQNEVPAYQTIVKSVPVLDENGDPALDENGEPIVTEESETVQTGTEIQETEWDNSAYSLAGDLTDHRDGTITAKMGKLTDLEEAYEIMLGGI